MDRLMEDIIETAHNFTMNMQEHGLTLDYSAESLREVDDLLEAFRQEALDEDGRFNLFSMVGCYVFETARRCYGGKYFWIEEEQQPISTIKTKLRRSREKLRFILEKGGYTYEA